MLEIGHKHVSAEEEMQIAALEQQILGSSLYSKLSDFQLQNQDAARDHRIEYSFMLVAALADQLQNAKNKHYDNSWSKRGLFSMFFNVERKYERFSTGLFNGQGELQASDSSEAFLDTLIDLTAYVTKTVAWIAIRRPDLYLQLLRNIARETGRMPNPKSSSSLIQTMIEGEEDHQLQSLEGRLPRE